MPIGVCQPTYSYNESGYDLVQNYSEQFVCSEDKTQVLYKLYNNSLDCKESANVVSVAANYSYFNCDASDPCPYTFIKSYQPQGLNTSNDCPHLSYYYTFAATVDICVQTAPTAYNIWKCNDNHGVQLSRWYDEIKGGCNTSTPFEMSINTGCNPPSVITGNEGIFAEVECPVSNIKILSSNQGQYNEEWDYELNQLHFHTGSFQDVLPYRQRVYF